MNHWENIETVPDDPQIITIDLLEKSLGQLPPEAQQIRELITHFEVCHFKYRDHISYIKKFIYNLTADIDPDAIGSNHIRHGESVCQKDKTGRSLIGQQYIWALKKWLGDDQESKNEELEEKTITWLGKKTEEKEKLVRLLIARLTWDWEALEKLQLEIEDKVLENQVIRMDICHYNFPQNIDSLLQGIGNMKAVEAFEGCGTSNAEIKGYIEREINKLSELVETIDNNDQADKNELIKKWLIVSLIKTLKAQVGMVD